MGLIKAVVGSVVGTLSDSWKDYFVCDSLDNNTLMVKGTKRGYSGSDEVITNGSGIVVNDGQCALVVENGNVLEVAAEPGQYTFDSSISPTIFDGGMDGIRKTFEDALERFSYGGDVNKSQRVYYVNTKEIMGNMYGTATPIPFRVVDHNIGLDVDVAVRMNGEYTFRIANPLTFYQKVAGNKADRFTKDELLSIMKAEMMDKLNPAFSRISQLGIRYSELPAHTAELKEVLAQELNAKWLEDRGIEFVNIAVNSVTIPDEDERKIRDLQMAAVNKDKEMANATLVSAAADAMRDAANNANGATTGFMGVNMAQNVASGLMQNTQSGDASGGYCPFCGKPVPVGANFCPSCGKQLN
ncbi:MAG: SPFH domain-containing protein [Erysipelotrichaceae bacterium]|nr:SPFH domain-containing protein [Erysipelotrichaceae bacterium]